MCWYFGKNLADQMAKEAELMGEAPIPIGLIHSSIGGTTIQQWMPPSTVGNATCAENNCDYVEQLDPRTPIQPRTEAKCTNVSQSSVWSCPSGTCSDLWHGMIAPWVNVTISGAIWYQGTHPIVVAIIDVTSSLSLSRLHRTRQGSRTWPLEQVASLISLATPVSRPT
jgi:hypothetical protein